MQDACSLLRPLTFFLVDRLLEVGGYIDFDDYNWSLAISPTLAPDKFPRTLEMYTSEQIEDRQVKRVVDPGFGS
jgi:hypothetical protein